jgi:hypothetical protein
MNTNGIAKQYSGLKPAERFALVMAASNRGDDTELARLANSGERVRFSLPDHAPYFLAFTEMADYYLHVLLDHAGNYFDMLHVRDDAEVTDIIDNLNNDAGRLKKPRTRATWPRLHDLVLATGFILKNAMAAWDDFCKRLDVSPFAYWERFPTLERLQRALALADEAAFTEEGFLRFLNDIRPEGEPPLLRAESANEIADALVEAFNVRVQWWS